MKLKSLRIQNFGGFEDTTIEFDPHFTVLAGPNGSGKTTVLEAAARIWTYPFSSALETPRLDSSPKKRDQTRIARVEATPSFEHPATKHEIKWVGEAPVYPPATILVPAATLPGLPQRLGERLVDTEPSALSTRLIHYAGLLTWLLDKSIDEALYVRDRADYVDPPLDAVRGAMSAALPGLERPRIDGTRTLKVNKGDTELRIEELSSGEAHLITLAGALQRHLDELRAPRPSSYAKGISPLVLIDEIEQHLHPRWQAEIVPSLLRAFPDVQFIATTHSPIVVSSLEKGQLVALDSFRVKDVGSVYPGRDANANLEEVFGVSARPEAMVDRLSKIEEQLDAGDIDGAREALRVLKQELPSHDLDVVRLQTLIDFA